MTHTIQSLHSASQPAASEIPVIGAVYRSFLRRWTKILSVSGTSPCFEQAIAVLADSNAMPGEKDWAERYLCGMTGQELAAYLNSRPAQT